MVPECIPVVQVCDKFNNAVLFIVSRVFFTYRWTFVSLDIYIGNSCIAKSNYSIMVVFKKMSLWPYTFCVKYRNHSKKDRFLNVWQHDYMTVTRVCKPRAFSTTVCDKCAISWQVSLGSASLMQQRVHDLLSYLKLYWCVY